MKSEQYFPAVVLLMTAMLLITGCTPRNPSVRRERGTAALKEGMALSAAGDNTAAIKALKRAAKLLPHDPSTQSNLGIALWRDGRQRRAIKAFRKAADNSAGIVPPDARPLELLADLYLEIGETALARDALDEAYQRLPHSPRILCRIAALEIRDGDPQAAEPLLREALARDPAYAPALYNLGIVLRDHLGHKQEAITVLKRFAGISGGTPRGIAIAEWLQEQSGKQSGMTTQAVLPPEAQATLAQARRSMIDGNADQSVILFRNIIKEYPQQPDPFWELCIIYKELLNDPEKADALHKMFAQTFPNDPRSSMSEQELNNAARSAFGRAMDFHREGRLIEAVTAYNEVLQLTPAYTEAAYNLGQALRAQEQYELAINAFYRVLLWQPVRAENHYILAMALYEAGQRENAVAALREALRLNADYARAHYLMGLINSDHGKKDLARIHFTRFLNLAPQDPAAASVAAWLRDNS